MNSIEPNEINISLFGKIYTKFTTIIPAKSSKIIDIDFENKRHVDDNDYFISYGNSYHIFINNSIVTATDGSALVLASNLSNKDYVLRCGEDVGYYESLDECQQFKTNLNLIHFNENSHTTDADIKVESGYEYTDPDQLTKLIEFELGEIKVGIQITDNELNILKQLLIEFKDVLAFDGHLGTTTLIKYEIEIDRSRPVHVPPYRVSPQQRSDIIDQALAMLEKDVIEPCRSPWSSPIIIIRKPESKGGGFRFVNDFRAINKLTKNWVYELPLIGDHLRSLSGYNLFCSLDANSGFWQIPVKEEDRDVTAFLIPGFGSFRYKKMPMGAKTAPQTFQALMDIALGSLKYTAALTYLDDILIPAMNFNELIEKLRLVLTALRDAGVTLKPQKCLFAVTSLRFLGFIID